MNRADLEWALKAVLPHVGSEKSGLNYVHFEYRYALHALSVYTTDKYTIGIAEIPAGPEWNFSMTAKEATDLMRSVRPSKVAERDEEVAYALRPGELHVGWGEGEDAVSEVYETTDSRLSFDFVHGRVQQLYKSQPEWDECVLQPKLLEKFAKAARSDTDRLTLLPRHAVVGNGKSGAAVVTVGGSFIGAIAGLTYDGVAVERLASFLDEYREAA